MEKASVADLARRVQAGDAAAALGAQKTYQSAQQKAGPALTEIDMRVRAATRIGALVRGAKVRQEVAATSKMKAQRMVVGAVVGQWYGRARRTRSLGTSRSC